MAKRKASEPVWWRWKVPQIEAAEREPEKYARELAEMREYAARELQRMAQVALPAMDSSPRLLLYRKHRDLLETLPALKEATLDEALDTVEAVQRYGARKAAAAGAGKPRASRHAPDHPAWLRAAQQAAARHPDGTSAARKRKITAALVEAAPGIPRRTLAAFVASRWRDISTTTPRR